MGEEAEPRLRPDAEGDATPGRKPLGTRLPKREPSLGAGRIQHPLPDPSEQDGAKIARNLADERAKLDEQSAGGAPDQNARASQVPSSMPHAFLARRRRAAQRRRAGQLAAIAV